MITPKLKWLFVPAVLLFGWLFIKSCDGPEGDAYPDDPLPVGDVLHVDVRNHEITVQTATGQETQYVPDKGSSEIQVDDKGNVTFKVKNKGMSFVPVIGPIVTDKLDLGLGAQLAYWNRFELHAGVAVPHLAGFAAVGYRLDQIHLNNTSIAIVYTTRRYVGGAILLRF